MLKKQYVSKRLLPIIVAFVLVLGFMVSIQGIYSYAEDDYPSITLKHVGAYPNADVSWRVLKTDPDNNYDPANQQFVDYELGTPIERTWNKDVVPYFSVQINDIAKCGTFTGAELQTENGDALMGIFADDLDKGVQKTDIDEETFWRYPGLTSDEQHPENTIGDTYTLNDLIWNNEDPEDEGGNNWYWSDSFLNFLEQTDGELKWAEIYWTEYGDGMWTPWKTQIAKENTNHVIVLFFNGEERKLRFDVEDEDLTVEVGEKSTRAAKTQSSYYSENAAISYASSDDSIATVDVSSGEVTGVAEGEATITASIQDGNKESSKTYKVIVSKASDPAVDAVIEKINSIDDPVTLNSEEGITAARQAYNALGEDQKTMIDAAVLKKLTDAEEALKELKAAPVINQIDSIGDITEDNYLQKESDILDAQTAYNALSADIQPFVTNYAKLLEARIAVAEFKLESAKGDLVKVEQDKEKAEQELQNLKDEIAAKALTVSGLKVTSKKKKFTVKWKKNSEADGYQVKYKLKSAKKYKNLKTLTGTKAVSKKLKKNKKYQFRVRTYRLVNGKTIYGKWSGVKTCVCK